MATKEYYVRKFKIAFTIFGGIVCLALLTRAVFLWWNEKPIAEVIGQVAGSAIPALFSALLAWDLWIGKTWNASGARVLNRDVSPNAKIRHALSDTRTPENRLPDDVVVAFHTYLGFLIFWTQTEWRFAVAPDEAKQILWRMHRHNLIWGWICPGALFIPFLSLFSYQAQLWSIRRQTKKLSKSISV